MLLYQPDNLPGSTSGQRVQRRSVGRVTAASRDAILPRERFLAPGVRVVFSTFIPQGGSQPVTASFCWLKCGYSSRALPLTIVNVCSSIPHAERKSNVRQQNQRTHSV